MNQSTNAINPARAEIIEKIDDLNNKAWDLHISNPKLGLELADEAKRLSDESSYQSGLAYALRNMGVSHRYLSNLETALSLSFQALDLFEQMGDKNGEAQVYVSVGSIYYYMGDFERSLEYFLKGEQYNEETGNNQALAYAINGAGYIYSLQGDHKKGLEFLQRALTISKEVENAYSLQISILDSMAVTYLNDGQIDEAYKTYLECLQLSEQFSQKVNMGYALFGIGELFVRQNRLDEAKEYFLRSLAIRREIGYKVGEANSLLQLGKLTLQQEDSEKAKEYLLESLKVAEDIKAKAIIYNAHEALAELFETKKDIQSFVKHYKLYHKYKSEVFTDEQESKQKYRGIQNEMDKLLQETEINRKTNLMMKEKNAQLEKKTEELEQSYNSVFVLSKIGRDITSTLDLDTILNTVYENVNQLMDATVFGIGIYKPEEESIEYRLSIEEGKRYQPYYRYMSDKGQLAVWCIENNKEVFINNLSIEYSKYVKDIDLTVPESVILEDGSKPQNPTSVIYLPLQVKDKVIGLISVQSYEEDAYSQYHLDMLKTLASYTSAALYNAQKLAEVENLSAQTIAQELEKQQILASQNITLEKQVEERTAALSQLIRELKEAQAQLIQSEKMASLGELTAGIAHEIQNPLNFVNNFSEVNKELLLEMQDEIENGNMNEVKNIANDVIANEEKISEHGKRADSIVKGMLQHSRISSNIKELTDINSLADEYLRLAYHGLRAKDKSFNATLQTDYDENIGKINIIPQDIGRAILNLITNAFYVVAEKKKQQSGDFQPTVSISTKKRGDKILVSVRDNGPGIPEKIVDKIFQPFFTTKPTGQGTGLGLSLSYDIVRAHGGELKVETKEGEGTEFTIVLPA